MFKSFFMAFEGQQLVGKVKNNMMVEMSHKTKKTNLIEKPNVYLYGYDIVYVF